MGFLLFMAYVLLDMSLMVKYQSSLLDILYFNNRGTTLVVVGDLMLGRRVNQRIVERGDFSWPFKKIRHILEGADITLANLEAPLMDDCQFSNEGFRFCADKRNAQGLADAGIDLVSLANNHAEDFDERGINETILALEDVGMASVGLGKPVFMRKDDITFAFLSFNDVRVNEQAFLSNATEDLIKESVASVQESDVIVVMFHWGDQYMKEPNARQRALAHLAINYGAQLVVGSHPHSVQSIEKYKEGLIVYSLGNFIADEMYNEPYTQEANQGVIGRFHFNKRGLFQQEFIPTVIKEESQSWLAEGADKKHVLRTIYSSEE